MLNPCRNTVFLCHAVAVLQCPKLTETLLSLPYTFLSLPRWCRLASEEKRAITQGGDFMSQTWELAYSPSTYFYQLKLYIGPPLSTGILGNVIQLCAQKSKQFWCTLSSLCHRLNHLLHTKTGILLSGKHNQRIEIRDYGF